MTTTSATVFSVVWAMSSRWTFSIPPITEFVRRWIDGADIVVDPFCGNSRIATHRNDLAMGGVDALEWCESLVEDGLVADAVLFDPPYSPRQIAECYASIGRRATKKDTQNSSLYSAVRRPLALLLKPGGVALSFGWQSGGFGKAWPTEEIMLVQHGGAHSDTICVAQRKPVDDYNLFGFAAPDAPPTPADAADEVKR